MFNDFGHCDGCGHLHCICDQREACPAPKEEVMVAPTVKTIPRFNVSQEHLIKDSFGKYIEYKHVEKHMTQESATLLAAVAKVRELTAERDRLAAENAELRTLIAHMKAESLRVVADTQRGYHYMTPSGIGWHSVDKSGNPCVETPTDYHDFADCQPVRLERWEANHGRQG